jgi:hypothetical protein
MEMLAVLKDELMALRQALYVPGENLPARVAGEAAENAKRVVLAKLHVQRAMAVLEGLLSLCQLTLLQEAAAAQASQNGTPAAARQRPSVN